MIKKILIVDDSPVARLMVKSSLPQDKGYEIFFAQNGQEGLDKFKEYNPDVTFLDLTMPVMNGLECLEKIMKIDNNAIVIVLTADVQPQSMEKVMSLGAFRMLKKPADKDSIRKILMNVEGKAG